MKRISLAILVALASSCAEPPVINTQVDPGILSEVDSAAKQARLRQPDAISDALLPPLRADIPKVPGAPVEPRFDLVVNAAPAQQVFMSIVSGTRYSMLLSPSVGGTISVNLKDVTVREALDSIREVYGYEYKIDGARIHVQPAGLQTRVFQVSYMIGLRSGRSDVRVSSGVISGQVGGAAPPAAGAVGVPGAAGAQAIGGQAMSPALGAVGLSAIATTTLDASRVSTVSQSDLWNEVNLALRTMIGTGEGRNVVVSPQSGVIVVRAMPEELRSVEAYLRAMRLAIERQVVIEAKIVDVTLNGSYQTGINWAGFRSRPSSGISAGQVSPGTLLDRNPGNFTGSSSITGPVGSETITGPVFGAAAGQNLINFTNPGASLLGLAFQTRNFSALLTFLETQGSIQVLSSPRIATLNNQKAVLKVGTDEMFLTKITATTAAATVIGGQALITLTPEFNPFFSGVSLDITPQIDEEGNILLHIHPLVSNVTGSNNTFNFGTGIGTQALPLPKSAINESDTVVRVQDGNIVALGGLMQTDVEVTRSGVPGLQDIPGIGEAFRSTTRTRTKRELVILMRPTVIKGDKDWEQDIEQVRDRMQAYGTNAGSAPPR